MYSEFELYTLSGCHASARRLYVCLSVSIGVSGCTPRIAAVGWFYVRLFHAELIHVKSCAVTAHMMTHD